MKPDININVGDKVISIYGKEGIVTEICKCSLCAERGWFEPVVTFEDGQQEWINDYEANHGFTQWYQVGENIFPEHLHYDELNGILAGTLDDMKQLTQQADNLRNMIKITSTEKKS